VQGGEEDLEKVFQESGLSIEEMALDPMVGICKKRDLRGRDGDVLNIRLNEIKIGKQKKNPMELREKILLVSFIVVFIACAAFIFIILQSRK